MEISEVDRRVAEFGALIKCQLRLVRQFAKIVLDRLRERFFWPRKVCIGLGAWRYTRLSGPAGKLR